MEEALKGNTGSWVYLDFEQARASHLLFKTKLRSILYGADVDETPVVSHTECTVGKWLYSHALRTYSHIPEIHQMENVHADLHSTARKLVQLYREGKIKEARGGLSEIERIGDKMTSLLTVIEEKVLKSNPEISGKNASYEALRMKLPELDNLHQLYENLNRQIREQSNELFDVKERFELVTKATQDAIWDWEITTGNAYRGEGFHAILEYGLEEIDAYENSWEAMIHPEDYQDVTESINRTLESGETYWEKEYRIRRKTGEYAYVKDRGIVLRDAGGKAIRMIGALRDISETRYYLTLERLEREILERNAQTEKDLKTALDNYMREIESLHPGMICSILEIRNDHLYNLASPNLPKEYRDAIEGLKIGNNVGSCGTAAFLKQKVIVTDIQTDIRWADFRDIAAKANLRACWSHPIVSSKAEVMATFACYYQEPKAPTKLEEHTIERTGHILQIILENNYKERELRESNKRYELVTKATNDAIWDWDVLSDKIYFNEEYKVLFGHDHTIRSLEEAWSNHIHEEDRERVWSSFRRSVDDPSVLSWKEDYRFIKADGAIAYVHDRGVILRDGSGKAIRMVGAMQNITERKQFEATLAQREEQFRTLANSIFQLAWMADANGWIHWYNDRWYEYTGTSLEEMQGWGWQKVHHPDHVTRVVAFVQEAWQKGEPWELTFPLRRYDGEFRWFLTRVFPVKDQEGKVLQWIGTNTDIESQKQTESLLEERVKARTLELERRNKELEQFTHVSHHDLQEPLRKIILFSEMVKSDSYDRLTEASQKRFDKITDAARRMSMALRDVLNYASLSKEEMLTEIDLDEILAAVQTDLELVIAEKHAKVVSDSLPSIRAVPQQMHQLFYNLLNNALKFSKREEPPVITIECKEVDKQEVKGHPELDLAKQFYKITFRDNGIGFNQEASEKIFGMFQRLHNKDAYAGTGIGLALVKKVVTNHHGKIWAEGNPGQGATFYMLLPAK